MRRRFALKAPFEWIWARGLGQGEVQMRLRHKIAGATLLLVSVSLIAMAIALSYKSECAPALPPPQGATLIKAIVFRCYGPPEVLELEAIAKPMPAGDELLVQVRAGSGNA